MMTSSKVARGVTRLRFGRPWLGNLNVSLPIHLLSPLVDGDDDDYGNFSQTKMYFTFTFAFQIKKNPFNFDLKEPVTDWDQLCKGLVTNKLSRIKILKITPWINTVTTLNLCWEWQKWIQTSATSVTLHPLRQTFWGGIWKHILEKSQTNATSVTLPALIQVL